MPTPSNRAIRYFGDYILFGRIAEGAMGEVWYARQDSLNRPVALKLIRAGTLASSAEVERFRVEAQAAARLNHPDIVRVFEVGTHEGRHFFSMELIEGSSLAMQIKEGLWRPDRLESHPHLRAAGLLVTMARAVHHAHQRGVLHRDIKPANILIDEQGGPHLSDFGLAKLLDTEGSMTRSGAILGTLGYMSPEQAAGHSAQATTASDIYSLGVVLYELLTGRPPFRADSVAELLRKVVEEEPVPPSRIRSYVLPSNDAKEVDSAHRSSPIVKPVDPDLETICLKCLEKVPGRRYATAEVLAEDLERWRRGEPIMARPVTDAERAWKWVRRHPLTAALSALLAGALLVGLATTTWQWRRAERQRALTSAAHTRLQMQRVEDSFGSDKAQLALPILARVLRDGPWERVAQERLVNALNQRSFLAPVAAGRVSSALLQLGLRTARSPDGTRIATATNAETSTIQLWNAASGTLLHTFNRTHSNVIRGLAFSSDNRRLVSSSADGDAKIWDAIEYGPGMTLAHPAAVHSAEFSPNAAQVLTAAHDGVVRLWNAQTGRLLLAFSSQRVGLNMARFHPYGGLLATGADDGTVQLWILNGNRVDRFTEPFTWANAVWNLEFHTNSLVVSLDDGTTHTLAWTRPFSLRPLGAGGQQPTTKLTAPPEPIPVVLGRLASQFHAAAITSVDTSPDHRLIATASVDKTARLWHASTGEPAGEPLVHRAPINCIRFSSDGLRVVTSTPGQVARVWDVRTGQPLTDWIVFERPVARVAFSGDGAWLETSGGELWPVHRAREAAPLWLPELAESLAGVQLDELGRAQPAVDFSGLRQRLTSSTETNAIVLWAKHLLEGGPP